MPVDLNHFRDGRLVREKVLLDRLADQDDVAREIHIFVGNVAAVAERIRIGGEEALIRTGDSQGRRGLQAVVSALAFEIETLQANVAGDSFHQTLIPKRLLVGNVATVLILVRVPPALAAAHGILRELKNIRTEEADSALD